MSSQLTFVNHASFYIANDNSLLLIDPWVEGTVFNNGWSLLDNTTSNARLVHELAAFGRHTFIWYSHEHPDHFSISFLRKLQQEFTGKVTVLFQRTKDKRVLNFLQKNGFNAIECAPGATVVLDPQLAITVFPFSDGDSYCLIRAGERTILNLNDCALTSAAMCEAVRRKVAPLAGKIDLLFTQFGYANWVGNPFEPGLRRRAAAEKRERISLQIRAFAPTVTIPFASFVNFCGTENNYLNDYQNSAYTIRQWSSLSADTAGVRFMKPGDSIDLDQVSAMSLLRMSNSAVAHWERLGSAPRDIVPPEAPVPAAELEAAFTRYRSRISGNLPVLPWLLEQLGLIKPLRLHLPDIRLTASFSYVRGFNALPQGSAFDIALSSGSALFTFTNDYGFNTTHVNGKFRTAHAGALQRFSRFFMPQNLVRQGFGTAHPFATAGHLAGSLIGRLRPGN